MRASLVILAVVVAGCHVTTVLPGARIAPGYDSYVQSSDAAVEPAGSLLLQSVEARTWELERLDQPLETVDPITLRPVEVFDPTILDLPRPLPNGTF